MTATRHPPLCAQLLGERVLRDRAPRRPLADIKQGRRGRARLVGREQPARSANLPLARQLELFRPVARLSDRGTDSGQQRGAAPFLDDERAANP